MKKHAKGASLYYATDKNVSDALNQHKVDSQTICELFRRRNTLVSKKTSRDELAIQFSRLTHDFYDHQAIAEKMDVTQRRERTTSLVARNIPSPDHIQAAIKDIKNALEAEGDVVSYSRTDDRFVVHIKYTIIDYARAEFTQLQHKDGELELTRSGDGYAIRSTQNEYIDGVREKLLSRIEVSTGAEVPRESVSLFDIQDPSLRSAFFERLTGKLPGFSRRDVTDVYVFKPRPEQDDDDDGDANDEPHIERVALRGKGVGRTELFSDLAKEDYYVVKVVWISKEILGSGHEYILEAAFSDPAECTKLSLLVAGVFPSEEGVVSKRRRSPFRSEIDAVSRIIEVHARATVDEIRSSIQEG